MLWCGGNDVDDDDEKYVDDDDVDDDNGNEDGNADGVNFLVTIINILQKHVEYIFIVIIYHIKWLTFLKKHCNLWRER